VGSHSQPQYNSTQTTLLPCGTSRSRWCRAVTAIKPQDTPCSAVRSTKGSVPMPQREEVLMPTPGDGRRHHSTAPVAGRSVFLCNLVGSVT
jgi:hypothetical protein